MRRLMKLLGYLFEPENYALAVRAVHSAWLVRGWLSEEPRSPGLKPAIAAVEKAHIAPRRNWRISDSGKILGASGLIVRLPYRWGACVHQSLIAYRLLNGYGFAATINIGIPKDGSSEEGHAWVTADGKPAGDNMNARFLTVYRYSK